MKYAYYAVFYSDGQGWWYTIPDFNEVGIPDDLNDARAMAKEGVEVNVQWHIDDGIPLPAPTSREAIEENERNDPDNDGLEWFVELVEAEVSPS